MLSQPTVGSKRSSADCLPRPRCGQRGAHQEEPERGAGLAECTPHMKAALGASKRSEAKQSADGPWWAGAPMAHRKRLGRPSETGKRAETPPHDRRRVGSGGLTLPNPQHPMTRLGPCG